MHRWVFIGYVMLHLGFASLAQRPSSSIVFTDSNETIRCSGSTEKADSSQIINQLSQCLQRFHRKGYLAATIDSLAWQEKGIKAFSTLGPRYSWAKISADSLSRVWIEDAGVNTNRVLGKPVAPKYIAKTSGRVLTHLENSGYPFGKVTTQGTHPKNNTIGIDFNVKPGPYIKLDTLYIYGDAKVSRGVLESHLNFNKGAPYNHKAIQAYTKHLSTLQYLQTVRPLEVEFTPGEARIYVYLEERRANQFSGIVGFSNEDGADSKWTFTGDFNLLLLNSLNQGERLRVNWEAPGEGTQRLTIENELPYIAGSRVGAEANFSLYKKDSSYLNINPRLTILFTTSSGNTIGVGFEHRSSTVIHSLPHQNISDYSTTLYHVSLAKNAYAPVFLNTLNFSGSCYIGVGPRKVSPTPPDNEAKKNTHTEGKGWFSAVIPIIYSRLSAIGRIQVGAMRISSKSNTSGTFYNNELFLIGGSQTLRGFNQEQIATNAYLIGTSELHLPLAETSSIYAFYDHGLTATLPDEGTGVDYPSGLGVGTLLNTGLGILNLSYAIGRGYGQEFQLRDAKIHIGYTTSF